VANKSPYKYVSWKQKELKYEAKPMINGVQVYCGQFVSEKEAAKRVDLMLISKGLPAVNGFYTKTEK